MTRPGADTAGRCAPSATLLTRCPQGTSRSIEPCTASALRADLAEARTRLNLQVERAAVIEEAERLALLAQLLEEVERPVPPLEDVLKVQLRQLMALIASAVDMTDDTRSDD